MKLKRKYKDLNDTLRAFKIQVKDSLDFADQYLPNRNLTPAEIYKILKKDFVYVSDPPGVELIQSMGTMFSYLNPHNVYGAGDCDCASVAASACLLVCGYPVDIVLTGRNDFQAVHIYCRTGYTVPAIPFDLTENQYNKERYYPYRQYLPLLINK